MRRQPTIRKPYDGEARERDHKTWWDIRKLYKTGDQLQVRIKGDLTVKGAYMDLNKMGIQVFINEDARLAASSASFPFEIPDDGHVWIPRNLVLDVARWEIKKSKNTPNMVKIMDKQREGRGDTKQTVSNKLEQLLEKKGAKRKEIPKPSKRREVDHERS